MDRNITGIGELKISEDVIAKIVSVAVNETEGVAGLISKGIINTKKNITKGIKVEEKEGNVNIDISVTLKYGVRIQDVGAAIQENVVKAVESMTGVKVSTVNVNVQGISFEKGETETAEK